MARHTQAARRAGGAPEPLDGLLADVAGFLAEAPATEGGDRALLASLLDRLAVARRSCPSAAHPAGPWPPRARPSSDAWRRARMEARFPGLGLYAAVEPVLGAEPELPVVGDAVGDLVDVAGELERVTWYLVQAGPGDAARYYAWSYDLHWGRHLRELQLYLHALGERA